MTDNKQVDSRIQANSTSPRSHYGEQQLAIQDAERAQERAAQRAAEAAFAAAKRRPPQKNMSNTLDAGDFGGNPITVTPFPAATTPPKTGRAGGRKGK